LSLFIFPVKKEISFSKKGEKRGEKNRYSNLEENLYAQEVVFLNAVLLPILG